TSNAGRASGSTQRSAMSPSLGWRETISPSMSGSNEFPFEHVVELGSHRLVHRLHLQRKTSPNEEDQRVRLDGHRKQRDLQWEHALDWREYHARRRSPQPVDVRSEGIVEDLQKLSSWQSSSLPSIVYEL
ncbi:hypothetical protein PMAYCL1PPCAC_07107, partial [Pristionchus mayeri]